MKRSAYLTHSFLTIALLLSSHPTYTKTTTPAPEKQPEQKASFDETIHSWLFTLAEVLDNTNQRHYNPDPKEGMISAIEGFVSRLDPHSTFLDPKAYKNIMESTSGEFFGIGIVIDNTRQTKDKILTVIDTIPDGPADKAGIKPLDKLIEIDDTLVEGMSTEEAIAHLKGERNTKVTIKVLREGQPDILSFALTRDIVKEYNSLCFHMPDYNICYLSLTMFTDSAIKQIKNLLEQSAKKPYKALILDLRNNSGGLLSSAVDIAGLFLEKDSLVVSTKDKNGHEIDQYKTKQEPSVNPALPVFIMINNFTASAAEILAGSLKIHSENMAKKSINKEQTKLMVFLVGAKSFGKGSVQEVIPVSNNCALKLTICLYFLPNDTSIQGLGIEPDITIERRMPPTDQALWLTKFYGREQALTNYIKTDTSDSAEKNAQDKKAADAKKEAAKDKKDKTWNERAKEMLSNDNQLRETITLINLLDMGKKYNPAAVSNRTKAIEFLKTVYVSGNALSLVEIKC